MDSDPLPKWRSWLDTVQRDLGHTFLYRSIFLGLVDIVRGNPSIDQTSLFFGFLGNIYVDAVVMALRRQVKVEKDSVSLARLLEEIAAHPHFLTREGFYALYKGTMPEFVMARDFGRFAAAGASHIDPHIVRMDVDALRNACRAAQEYADRRVAHWDHRAPTADLTTESLHSALDTAGELVTKYYLLLFCTSLEITPIPQRPVYHIFSVPWLPPRGSPPKTGV